MAIETTYTYARANLAKLMDQVTEDRETVVIHRKGSEDVALIAASDLEELNELLRRRLGTPIQRE